MSKKSTFLILTIVFLVFDVVLGLVVFKPGIFKSSKQAERPIVKEEDQIKVADDKSGTTLSVNTQTIGQYEKFEISLKWPKEYFNPFDPDIVDIQVHFISPSGQEEVWPGFWYQDYSSKKETSTYTNKHGDVVTETKDVYTKVGEPFWMFRYAPLKIGEYQYYLTIKENSQTEARYPQDGYLSFQSVKSNLKGYISVSQKDYHYFIYSNGDTFFPVGHGPEMSSEKLQNMAEHKTNIVQAEFSPDFKDGIFGQTLGQYNLEGAFVFDELLRQAEDLGIYLQMTLAGWPEFSDDNSQMGGNSFWDVNPYNKKNGGMLDYPAQFFLNEEAKKYFKDRLRYRIARWGYSTNVFCWQLWGEYDMVGFIASQEGKQYYSEDNVLSWHQEMGEYIKSLDQRHMATTAEANGPNEALWQLPSFDYLTIHDYDHPIDWNLPKKLEIYQNLGIRKPILVQEYGPEFLLGNQNLKEEANRVAYHNPFWQTTMIKLSGAPMKWTWYDDPREKTMNLDEDYQILSEFFAGTDLANKGINVLPIIDLTPKQYIEPITATKRTGETKTVRQGGTISPVEIYGIGNFTSAYIWMHDLRYSEFELQNSDYRAATLSGVKFQLNNLTNGPYQVEFWNTLTGQIEKREFSASNGSLIVEVPDFQKDLAVKITKK